MARIPDTRNVPQTTSVRDPGLSIPDQSGSFQALTQAGAQIQAKAAEIKRKQQAVEDVRFLADFKAETRRRMTEQSLQFQGQEADPDYPKKVTEAVGGVRESVLREYQSRYSPSEEALARAYEVGSGFVSTFEIAALTDNHNAKVESAVRSTEEGANELLNVLIVSPDKDTLTATVAALDDEWEALRGIVADDKLEDQKEASRGAAYATFVQSLVDKDRFGAARQFLKSDEAISTLDPKTTATLMSGIARGERAFAKEQQSIANQILKAAEKELGAVSDVTFDGFVPNVDRLNAVLEMVPEDQREGLEARRDALIELSERTRDFAFWPEAVQRDFVGSMEDGMLAGEDVSPQQLELLKLYKGIMDDTSERRRYDATPVAAAAGDIPQMPEGVSPGFSPEYLDYLDTAIPGTIESQGPLSQPVPRAAIDLFKVSLQADDVNERTQAITALAELNDTSRKAIENSVKELVTPQMRVAMSLSASRPGMARAIVEASMREVEFKEAPDKQESLRIARDVFGNAVAAANPRAIDDLNQTALTLVGQKYWTGDKPLDFGDLVDAYETELRNLTSGQILSINDASIMVEDNLRASASRDTAREIERSLSRLASAPLPEQGAIIVPFESGLTGGLVPEARDWEFTGLYYGGADSSTGEPVQVSFEDFASAPLSPAAIADGVYVPQVSRGGVRGPVFAGYVDPEGNTRFFRAAIELPALLSENRPAVNMSERSRLQQIMRTNVPGSEVYKDAQRRLNELGAR